MKTTIIAAGLLAFAISTAAVAQTASTTPTAATTPGYDRPAPNKHQSNGHQHVVYWSDFFDRFDFDPQTAADASSVDELTMKPKATKQGK